MKTRFNSYDIVCAVTELQSLVGLRVNQIYDVDNKTYLIRLQGGETKIVLLIESGVRFHTTSFEWPKNVAPSGFSMKLRKHLKNKRLETLKQLGVDRVVDFQFGAGEAACHIILELYDRGNVVLTDHEYIILYILRPHSKGEECRFAVREKYPIDRAKEKRPLPTENEIRNRIENVIDGENLKYLLMPLLDCGPSVIDHVLNKQNLNSCIVKNDTSGDGKQMDSKVKKASKQKKLTGGSKIFQMDTDFQRLMLAIKESEEILKEGHTLPINGYIIQKQEEKPSSDDTTSKYFYQNVEYHPYLFDHCKSSPYAKYDSFMLAVDEFYSTMEGQKIDMKTIQKEREALKKLSNVKEDHAKRLEELSKTQENDKQKAELITRNQSMVDNAILAIRSAIANQMSWPDIHELVKAAQSNMDPVARTIKQLKLEVNHISLTLEDPYRQSTSSDSNSEDDDYIPTMVVDVDLALSAWANARRYYDQKRSAAQKQQKTIDASTKALKSAERKTLQTLKDVRTISTISKARKIYWFEKFYWFISSENYLVIGGRDAQQNELIVKRYMRSSDIYVHAEIQGASSVIIRNPSGGDIPPKTLLEAGTMAISYSVAWDAKVVTNAYWVRSEQVSKTAPTGEFLGTGSFMVRGKKNFLPPCHLIMGLSLLFKLEDGFIERHRGERKVRTFDDEQTTESNEFILENENLEPVIEDEEIKLEDDEEELKPQEKTEENFDDAKLSEEKDRDDSEEEMSFPNTQIKIEHDTGHITVQYNSDVLKNSILMESEQELTLNTQNLSLENDEMTIIPAVASRKKQQKNSKKQKEKKDRKTKNEVKQIQDDRCGVNEQNRTQMKRGQRGKLKKMKSKYKDQDDEERELRMQILKSAGSAKLAIEQEEEEEKVKEGFRKTEKYDAVPKEQISKIDENEEFVGGDVDMVDSLTGIPFDDDELLFAIPVVAPYQALQNFKYKVKLTPGTGKRGRAAKTALMIFSKDKNCTMREKDLLKGIKEETLARNIPGKVKISAPQLQKFRK